MLDALLLSVPLGSELADARARLASPAVGTPSMAPPLAAAALAAVAALAMVWTVILGPTEVTRAQSAGPVTAVIGAPLTPGVGSSGLGSL